MVQVIDEPIRGNIWGRIGRGVAQGVSEQFPKEIERMRLAKGLEQFSKEENLTPLQSYAKLAAIPGITPEHLYTVVPLLRQQMQREEGGKGRPPEPVPFPEKPSSISEMKPPEKYAGPAKEAGAKPTLKPIAVTQAQLTPFVAKSQDELYSEARELSRNNPNTYPTPADALPRVTADEQTRAANYKELRDVGNAADVTRTRLKNDLETYWGKEKVLNSIPGTVQTKLLEDLEAQLADPNNKLTEQQLLNQFRRVGKDIGYADTNLKERAAHKFLSGNYTPKKIVETIDQTRKPYKEAEATEEFKDNLINQFNLSEPVANYFSDPPENKTINKIINESARPKPTGYGVSSAHGHLSPSDVRKKTIEIADKITPHLKDSDSLLSYALSVNKKNLDSELFFERIKQNAATGMFQPSPRQRREMATGFPFFPTLGDFYILSITDQDKLLE